MKGPLLLIPIFAALLLGSLSLPSAFAQFQSGGVDKEGSWYAGEGLKQGDFFSYSLCHVDYKECAKFEMDMWIKGDKQVGSETKWLAEVVIYDGNKRVVGEMELGK
ncbi:MAG: peptidase, partial [Nitrosopumilus sp.]|nr:peptidase [Nitrosopumilus sp.]